MKKLLLTLCAAVLMTAFAASPLAAEDTTPSADGSKLIALTFDDGPGKYTEELLDGLAARDAKATFFLVGTCVTNYPELVRREYNEGHQIANHTWSHPELTKLSASGVQYELTRTENAIDRALGFDIGRLMLRPPYGSHNASVRNAANVPVIYWTVDTLDWKYRNADTVKNNIVNGARDGAIILLHDIHATSVKGALAAIDELQKQGYTFVTVEELFRRKGITPQNGALYTEAPDNGVDLGPKDPYAYDETKLREHWAYDYITYTQEQGLMVGIGNGLFGPEYPMTRAMFATVLARLSGEDLRGYENPFTDVKNGEWYSDAVSWAAAKGIIKGHGNNTFAPDDYVTREEAAVMIANFLAYYKLTNNGEVVVHFHDDELISHWAKDEVTVVVNKGIMNGIGNGLFDPQGTATRAQAATILTKLHQTMIADPALMEQNF